MIDDTLYKVHPSIAWNHPPFVAIQDLKAEHGFSAADVESVTVKGLGAARIADYAPAGEVDAMFSLPYTVALTILGDPLMPEMYSDGAPPLRAGASAAQTGSDRRGPSGRAGLVR